MMTETNAQACSSSRLVSPRARTTVEILDLALGMGALACDGEVDCPFSSPPLDEVTLYSSTETDCSSTCSSEYLEEGDSCSFSVVSSCPATPRSIFQRYWEKQLDKKTEGTINLVERSPSPDVSELSASSEDSTQASSSDGARPNHQRRRRRIFNEGSGPAAALPQDAASLVAALRRDNRQPRKTQSSPTFSSNGSKPASCLRSKRRRSDSTMSSSSSSVTFSPQVDVVYFERPKELWASDGWSKFFSS